MHHFKYEAIKVKRVARLVILIGTGLLAGGGVIFLGNYFQSSLTDYTAKATILAGVITFLGTVFTALYSEISSYYKDRSSNSEKKWNLIYPLIKQDYYPWINSALSLGEAFKLSIATITAKQVLHILYLIAVFYGYRLRFITGDGGVIILSSTKEENEVNQAYFQIIKTFQWAGDETPCRVSQLQELFISRNKKDDPYVLFKFEHDVKNDPSLQDSREKLEAWLKTDNNKQNVELALTNFTEIFNHDISKVYSAWET